MHLRTVEGSISWPPSQRGRNCARAVVRNRRVSKHLDSAGLLRLGGAHGGTAVGVLAALEAERLVVDGAQLPQVEEEEDGAGDAVEDTVPDHLGRRGDDVGAFGEGPTDRVRQEHEREEACRGEVALLEGTAGGEGRAGAVDEQNIP